VREDRVHPRLQSGAFTRPLNFTVRSHLGGLSVSKSWEFSSLGSVLSGWWLLRVALQASSFDATDVRVRLAPTSIGAGRAPSTLGWRGRGLNPTPSSVEACALMSESMLPSLDAAAPHAHSGGQ
jgi:hypothetical protein